ncbi:hypothetical protein E2C01_009812 [Portunus trituberculatus]|uniref:Uncharacterized protein n=1 Tax=Portunus trituberculatus TaxID=210409 RepID=A0A5B7D6Q3_PORTR|nr:hypothetical protein [Portunus trituberculatus]
MNYTVKKKACKSSFDERTAPLQELFPQCRVLLEVRTEDLSGFNLIAIVHTLLKINNFLMRNVS